MAPAPPQQLQQLLRLPGVVNQFQQALNPLVTQMQIAQHWQQQQQLQYMQQLQQQQQLIAMALLQGGPNQGGSQFPLHLAVNWNINIQQTNQSNNQTANNQH